MATMAKILIVDDEQDILQLISLNLQRQGYETESVADGLTALKVAQRDIPDLILLDIMLPGMDGVQVFKRLRKEVRTRRIPVILLTARSQQADKIAGLELGADDYITKPFSPKELVLRVTNLLRRTNEVRAVSEILLPPFHLDIRNLKLYVDGTVLELTSTEFKLISILMENAGRVHRRADLLSEVWGYSDEVHTRTLDTHIKRLREKLGKHGGHICTLRGVGYSFSPDGQAEGEEGEGELAVSPMEQAETAEKS